MRTLILCLLGLLMASCEKKSDAYYVGEENVAVVVELRTLFNLTFREACAKTLPPRRDPHAGQYGRSKKDEALAAVLSRRGNLRAVIILSGDARDRLSDELRGLIEENWTCNPWDKHIRFDTPVVPPG